MTPRDVIDSEARLRDVLGEPSPRALRKEITRLDAHCRALIAASPFVVVASADAQGCCDASPKGDPAGFVRVLDDRTLAIPERPGNRRLDTLRNVLQNPRVHLLFLVPGKDETLRVNGRATLARDEDLRAQMAVAGKVPALAVVVHVDSAYIHCGRCMLRSRLWQSQAWPSVAGLPSHARCLVDHAGLDDDAEALERQLAATRLASLY